MYKLLLIILITISNYVFASQCINKALFAEKYLVDNNRLNTEANNVKFSKNNIYNLSGNARIVAKDYIVNANRITINKLDKSINANGGVRLQSKDLLLTSDNLFLKQKYNGLYSSVNNAKYQYLLTNAKGSSDHIESENKLHTMINATYSLCQDQNPDWQIVADNIVIDEQKNEGKATNAKLEFFGLPIGYLPTYSWVLSGRASGFLAPSFYGYNNSQGEGYQTNIPYYFNIAPDRDLTITLKNMSGVGSVVNGLYRQLLDDKNSRMNLELEAIDNDKSNQQRWLLNGDLNKKINQNFDLNVNLNRTSDARYFSDIRGDNLDINALSSNIKLSYNNENNNVNAYVFSENEQIINSGSDNYTKNLELSAQKGVNFKDNNFNITMITTSFKNKNTAKTTADRSHLQVDWSREFGNESYSLKPSANISTTHYDIDNADSQERAIYGLKFDSKLFLEREISIFDTDIIQTLTPRISYSYVPDKNQDNLPNFTSNAIVDTYESIFSGKKFTGIDRIAKSNNIAFGLDSNFIDDNNGNTYLNLKLARSINLDSKIKSNILTSANLTFENFNFKQTIEFDNDYDIYKRNSSIGYKKDGEEFININHIVDANNKRSAELYAAHHLSKNIHVFIGLNYSITDKANNYETTGFVYDSCCWSFRVSHFKDYYVAGDNYNYITKFELTFKGLASSNKDLIKRIKKRIPNYLPKL